MPYDHEMFPDRRGEVGAAAQNIALKYECLRGALVRDVSRGRDAELYRHAASFEHQTPEIPSTDLISITEHERRIIEVKGRGTEGPIKVKARELETMRAAGDESWLYVVWNADSRRGALPELVCVQNPARLAWKQVEMGKSPTTQPSVLDEASFQCIAEQIDSLGCRTKLPPIDPVDTLTLTGARPLADRNPARTR